MTITNMPQFYLQTLRPLSTRRWVIGSILMTKRGRLNLGISTAKGATLIAMPT